MSGERQYQARGPRLGLARLNVSDVEPHYLRWMNDPETVRFTEARHANYSIGDLRAYVEKMNASNRELLFGIFELAGNRHVGNIKVGPIHPFHATASLGLIIGEKDCWGRGYATEAIRLAVSYAFMALGVAKITAGIIAGHLASQRAFEKAGFRVEGVRRKQNLFEGERRDEILLGLLREEWDAQG